MTGVEAAAMDVEEPWRGQRLYDANLNSSRYEDGDNGRPDEVPTDVLADASVASSIIADGSGMHRPVLDVDLPVAAIPSSSPGHYHLYIDKPMTWDAYCKLLDVLVEVGIVEPGYVEASKRRGHTDVRLPWIRKPAEILAELAESHLSDVGPF